MAHDLESSKSMFFVGELPWHGLGVELPANATWQEASSAVGFYDVVEREVFVAGNPEALTDHKALTRSDDGRTLAIVGKGYGVVQFSDMAQAVMTAAGKEAVFHTGGLLGRNGERGWLLGELGEPLKVDGDASEIRKFFLAYQAHGLTSVILQDCATRVVCANTVGIALREQTDHRVKVRHTTNAVQRVQDAAVAFRQLNQGYEKFGRLANTMARTQFTNAQLVKTLDAVLPLPTEGEPTDGLLAKREKVQSLFEYGAGIDSGIRGTSWAAFQAWTEFADHHQKVRALPANIQAARLESIWFGSAADLKRDALQAIQAVAA